MESTPAIEVRHAAKSFRKSEVLHGISLAVQTGEIVGLVGPSGCGKTTLVDLVVGLTLPTHGSVRLRGEAAPYPKTRKKLGYMPQDTALYEDITATENLAFFGAIYGLKKAQFAERSQHALELARLSNEGNKMVGSFSGGMKRRLSLAIALLCEPDILVMDEPTVGLDPVHRVALWDTFQTLARNGSALLVTTHVMDEARRCDRVAMMRDGTLIHCDTPQAIIAETGCRDLEEAFVLLATAGTKEVCHA